MTAASLTIGRTVGQGRPLALPPVAVTQTFVVFGKRGSGKSNAGVVLAEEMYRIGAPFVALDPVGHWWGLKAKGDGSDGLPVYVFGGPNADLPLEPTAGGLMADVAVDHRIPMVLCLKGFSGAERARFVTDFAERLLKRNELPLHIFLEEADAYCPQRPMKGEERMLGAIDRLVRWGRQSGLGCTAITQRSAKINKDVTTQAEVLVAFRTLGPQDRDAIDAWIKYHEAGARRQEVLESLATLSDGEAWIWSPEWLEFFGRVQWRRRGTFDAGATPRVGAKAVHPTLAPVDLGAIRTAMTATIEKAKAEDPRELRRRIAELERQVAAKPATEVRVERVEVPVLDDAMIAKLVEAVGLLQGVGQPIAEASAGIIRALNAAAERTLEAPAVPARAVQPPARVPKATPAGPNGRAARGVVSGPQQRILDALARLESVRILQPKRTQVALFADASPRSSAFANNLGTLRSAGLIDYETSGTVSLTAAGMAEANPALAPATNVALHESLYALVSGPQARILRVLIDAYPRSVTKLDLAHHAEASPTSSAYSNNLGTLRSLGLIDYPTPGSVAAQPLLFLEQVPA
jgi:hypothetical protein